MDEPHFEGTGLARLVDGGLVPVVADEGVAEEGIMDRWRIPDLGEPDESESYAFKRCRLRLSVPPVT